MPYFFPPSCSFLSVSLCPCLSVYIFISSPLFSLSFSLPSSFCFFIAVLWLNLRWSTSGFSPKPYKSAARSAWRSYESRARMRLAVVPAAQRPRTKPRERAPHAPHSTHFSHTFFIPTITLQLRAFLFRSCDDILQESSVHLNSIACSNKAFFPWRHGSPAGSPSGMELRVLWILCHAERSLR